MDKKCINCMWYGDKFEHALYETNEDKHWCCEAVDLVTADMSCDSFFPSPQARAKEQN